MPDIYESISQDHREVESLFERYRSNADDVVAHRICAALTRHSVGEEEVVYPALRDSGAQGAALADEAVQDHADVAALIARVEHTPPADLRALMEAIHEEVGHHVSTEESALFDALRTAGVDSADLAGRFEEVKGRVETVFGDHPTGSPT